MSGLESGNDKKLKPCWNADIGDHVISLAWSADGSRLAAASVSGPIVIYQATTGEVIARIEGHGFGTTQVAWHPRDSQRLASSGQDGLVKLWDLRQQPPTSLQLKAGTNWVERIAWSPGGSFLASAAGRKLKLWDARGTLKHDWPDQASTLADIQWSPDGRQLASAAYGQLQIWNPDDQQPKQVFEWKGSMLRLAWSPDGNYIATGDQDKTVHFWFVRTGQDLQMSGYQTKVRELSWDQRSRYLATGGGTAPCIWDCSGRGPEGRPPLLLQGHQDLVSTLRYQARGPLLVSGGLDGQVLLWQPVRGDQPLGIAKFDTAITEAVWAPNDRQIALGLDSGTVVVVEWK